MKFQLLSDLHMEHHTFDLEKAPGADCLILAGDIGDPYSQEYASLLATASRTFEFVFVIKGNHECHHGFPSTIDKDIKELCEKHANIFYLQQGSVDLRDDIRVIGATLWTDIEDEQRSDVQTFITDFGRVPNWSVMLNNHAHSRDVSFVQEEMTKALADSKKLVVVTHHAPYLKGTVRPEYKGSFISSAFCTDLSELLQDPPIHTWAFGHTHHSCRFMKNGMTIIANQRGYPREPTGFDSLCTFDVQPRQVSGPVPLARNVCSEPAMAVSVQSEEGSNGTKDTYRHVISKSMVYNHGEV